jgi:hypothetical protein
MKNLIIISLLLPILLNAEISEKDALKFAEQYNLKDLNVNRANVDYAKDFVDVANKKIGKKYEYLKSSNINIDKYKNLEKINEKKPSNLKDSQPTKITKKDTTKEVEEKKLASEEEITYAEGEEVIYVNEKDLKDIEAIAEEKKKKNDLKNDLIFNLKRQSTLLEKKGVIKEEIEKIENDNKDYDKSQLTIFYFVSSDLDISNFNDFIAGIDKLKSVGYNIVGRVLFRGLIDERMDGIKDWMIKSEKDFKLRRTPNVKYQFHPWAFRYFSLEKVPAFALSACKKDFRFKTCEHKYLAKGNMSFQNFLEILKENNKEYEDLFFDLTKVTK